MPQQPVTDNRVFQSGVEITSREQFEEYIRAAARAGFPVAVHAIGDLANREALDAFEATQESWRPLGLRHRSHSGVQSEAGNHCEA